MQKRYVLDPWVGDLYMAAARKAAYGRLVDKVSNRGPWLTSQVDETKTYIYIQEKERDPNSYGSISHPVSQSAGKIATALIWTRPTRNLVYINADHQGRFQIFLIKTQVTSDQHIVY